MKKTSFTLIELLIVISILGVLISLIQPSMTKTLAVAESHQCKSNQGLIHRSTVLFTEDSGDKLPGPFWGGQIARFGRNNNTYNYRLNVFLMPYLEEKRDADNYRYQETFFCPNVKQSDLTANESLRINYFIAEWNKDLKDRPFGNPPYRDVPQRESMAMSEIPTPHLIQFMEDADYQNMYWAPLSVVNEFPNHESSYRNRIFFDGHIEKADWFPSP